MNCAKAGDLPKRHIEKAKDGTFDHPEWTKAFTKTGALMGTGAIVMLCGNRGTGKTQIAVKIISNVCGLNHACKYARAIDFFLDLRGAMNSRESDEGVVIKEYSKPTLLVIDDVHERGESEWESRMLFHLIDRRYGDLKDTILLTNQTKADALEALGPSIVDRLRETGGIIECNWSSFRRKDER